MMELQVFNNERFGDIRTIRDGDKVLFCGSDVAKALGYKSPKDAITTHAKGAVKRRTLTAGGEQEMLFISEGDIYRLAARSKLPGAEKFESWIFDEVIPSIRKHGAYMTPETLQAAILNPDYLLQVVTALKSETDRRKALEAKIAADAPAVYFANAITGSDTNILIRDLAKLLKQNGVDTGEKRLFATLRNDGYLIKSGSDYNMPTQRAMEMGLFFVKETLRVTKNGSKIDRVTRVTPKGQRYFLEKYAGVKTAPVIA